MTPELRALSGGRAWGVTLGPAEVDPQSTLESAHRSPTGVPRRSRPGPTAALARSCRWHFQAISLLGQNNGGLALCSMGRAARSVVWEGPDLRHIRNPKMQYPVATATSGWQSVVVVGPEPI